MKSPLFLALVCAALIGASGVAGMADQPAQPAVRIIQLTGVQGQYFIEIPVSRPAGTTEAPNALRGSSADQTSANPTPAVKPATPPATAPQATELPRQGTNGNY